LRSHSRISQNFMEPEGSLPCSQGSSTGSCPEPDQSILHQAILFSKNHLNIVARMWRLYKTGIGLTTGFIGSHTVTHNYSVYTSQLTVLYTRGESSHLCLHWLPDFQHRRICSASETTATASLTELRELTARQEYSPLPNSATHLYSRGTWLRLLLRHSRNTTRDVYCACIRHIVCGVTLSSCMVA
jgi:hypothetical protein